MSVWGIDFWSSYTYAPTGMIVRVMSGNIQPFDEVTRIFAKLRNNDKHCLEAKQMVVASQHTVHGLLVSAALPATNITLLQHLQAIKLQGFLWTYKVFYGVSTKDRIPAVTNQITVFVTARI